MSSFDAGFMGCAGQKARNEAETRVSKGCKTVVISRV